LAAGFRKLPAKSRGELPLRVREDAVEFTFRGEFPGDKFPWVMLEYLISPGERDYECLLVASDAELKRADVLGPFFKKHAGVGRFVRRRGGVGGHTGGGARVVWSEGGSPHSADLTGFLVGVAPKDATEFLDGLSASRNGVGGSINLAVDSASLPHRRVPATL